MIVDILGGILLPHALAFFLLSRIAMWEIRPEKSSTFRQDMRLLWAWIRPRWRRMVAHPLYWAGAGIVTAYFLIDPLRRLFL